MARPIRRGNICARNAIQKLGKDTMEHKMFPTARNNALKVKRVRKYFFVI